MAQWTRFDPVNMARVEVAPDGGIVVGGTPSAGRFGVAFLKYAADGTPLWANRDAEGPANAFLAHGQMRLDAAGNAYLAASNMSQMSVTRVNADGSTGWSMLAPFGYGVALAFGAQSQAVYLVGGQTARIDQGGAPPPLQCTLGTLAPGASATITRVVRPRSTGTLTTTATAATTTAESLISNNTATAQTTVTRR